MALAALLAVAVPTHFINPGGRFNGAVPRPPSNSLNRGDGSGNKRTRTSDDGAAAVAGGGGGSGGGTDGDGGGDGGGDDASYDFTRRGVYVAQVGARFERRGVMEAAHMLVDPVVNTAANGYGPPSPDTNNTAATRAPLLRAWARLYKAPGGRLVAPGCQIAMDHTPVSSMDVLTAYKREKCQPYPAVTSPRGTKP
jgi:hypothetical protein